MPWRSRGDRLFQVGTFILYIFQFGGDFLDFFLGAQIDATEPFPVSLELGKLCIGFFQQRQFGAWFVASDLEAFFRFATMMVGDHSGLLTAPFARGFKLCLYPSPGFADFTQGRLRFAQSFVALAPCRIRLSQFVGGHLAVGFRR